MEASASAPDPRDTRRARPLAPRRAGLLAALALLALALAPPGLAGSASTRADLPPLEQRLHDAVNAVRVEHGLLPLTRRPELDRVARAHSEDMAVRGYLAHETPEGLDPAERLLAAGVAGFRLAGENVGVTNRQPPNDEILQGWLASPVHRRNLLAPAFNAAGLGIAAAADGRLYYTQVYVTFER